MLKRLRKLGHFLGLLRHGQFFQAAERVFRLMIPQWCASLDDLVMLVARTAAGAPLTMPSDYEVSPFYPADLPRLLACHSGLESAGDRELFHSYFESGYTCYALEKAGKVLAYTWIFRDTYMLNFAPYTRQAVRLRLQGNIRVVGNLFTAPSKRNCGLATFLLDQVIQQIRAAAPATTFVSFINSENEPSLRAHSKVGFSVFGSYYYFAFPVGKYLMFRSLFAPTKIHRISREAILDLPGL